MELHELIFDIRTPADFERVALEIFHYQLENNEIYRSFAETTGRTIVSNVQEIPFLPIEFFKSHRVYCGDKNEELVFKSSGTTGKTRSVHYVKDAALYQRSFNNTYDRYIGLPEEQVILALLPNYLEQGESSLIYMVDHLIRSTRSELSGFILGNHSELKTRYDQARRTGKKVVIFGVSYALIDLAEEGVDLAEALIIETGGMKGRRKEITKEELHEIIKLGTGVPFVSSEYGMTELLSQAYSDKNGIFHCPDFMKVLIRDVNDPFSYVEDQKTGGINVIDLANLYSCSFIATQDLGKKNNDGFSVMGRFDHSDIRGCNLMIGE
jgi:hypothetical protein